MAEWHPKNKMSPHEVALNSHKIVWWLCNKSTCEHPHEWEAMIFNRVKGTSCPICASSKGEKAVGKILKNKKIKYVPQKKINIDKKRLYFDFYLPDLNAAIEFDGIQHFEPVDFFGGEESFLNCQIRDWLKNIYCSERGLNLLRIHYLDFDQIELLINDITKKISSDPIMLLSGSYDLNYAS